MMKAKIILHRDNIYYDVDAISYKYAETSVQDPVVGDKIASDTGERLDESIISRLCEIRYSKILQRLEFCLDKRYEDHVVIDDKPDDIRCFEFRFRFRNPVDKSLLMVVKNFLHDYMVKGVLLDWYNRIGIGFNQELAAELDELERNIVSSLRMPAFVRHPSAPYTPSYKIR